MLQKCYKKLAESNGNNPKIEDVSKAFYNRKEHEAGAKHTKINH